MNQKTLDQKWQQLQARIDVFLEQPIRGDLQSIEDSERLLSQLLFVLEGIRVRQDWEEAHPQRG